MKYAGGEPKQNDAMAVADIERRETSGAIRAYLDRLLQIARWRRWGEEALDVADVRQDAIREDAKRTHDVVLRQ